MATFAYLYHTISVVTLLRYHRICESLDAPLEQRMVVGKMVDKSPDLVRRMVEDGHDARVAYLSQSVDLPPQAL